MLAELSENMTVHFHTVAQVSDTQRATLLLPLTLRDAAAAAGLAGEAEKAEGKFASTSRMH